MGYRGTGPNAKEKEAKTYLTLEWFDRLEEMARDRGLGSPELQRLAIIEYAENHGYLKRQSKG